MPGNAWARRCTVNSRKREWPDKKQDLHRGLTDQLLCPDPCRCSPGTQRSPSRRSSFFQIGTPALIASMINREPSCAEPTEGQGKIRGPAKNSRKRGCRSSDADKGQSLGARRDRRGSRLAEPWNDLAAGWLARSNATSRCKTLEAGARPPLKPRK